MRAAGQGDRLHETRGDLLRDATARTDRVPSLTKSIRSLSVCVSYRQECVFYCNPHVLIYPIL